MSQVTLDLVSLDDQALVGVSRRFEGSGGTIGRDEGNTLPLPDPKRRVSRLHATISFPGGIPTITNSSAVLPIGVDGTQLESGQAASLLPGMNLSIGPYVLMVRPAELPARSTPLPVSAPATAPTSEPVAAPPKPLPLDPVDDPFAALLSSETPAAPKLAGGSPAIVDPFAAFGIGAGAGIGAQGQPPAAPAALYSQPAAAVIPEDFNPFDMPSASARNSADPLSSMSAGSAPAPIAALTQPEESIDALFAPADMARGDEFLRGGVPAADALGVSGARSSLLAEPENSDLLALFGSASPAHDSLVQPMRDDLAEIGGAYAPPRALDPSSLVASARPAPPSPVSPTDPPQALAMPSYPADALTRAFLTGANLPATALPQGLTPEIMAMVGSLLRSATAGAIDMLAVRASIKREVQANVTIISREDNNPLKFLLDADSVLQQLLGKKMRGFMRPDEAMKDAFNDLRAHELGVIAGTRAALSEVLTKFDPAILGDRLVRGSFLEMALPAMRKTKLWDLYLERYAQVRREVEDDFQSIFGKAFVAAYEEETARMKARTAQGS